MLKHFYNLLNVSNHCSQNPLSWTIILSKDTKLNHSKITCPNLDLDISTFSKKAIYN